MLPDVLLFAHLERQHLSDAHFGAAEHLDHIVSAVHNEAQSGPEFGTNGSPEQYVRFQNRPVVTVSVSSHSVSVHATEFHSHWVSAGRAEREELHALKISEVTQAHGHTCRGRRSQCQFFFRLQKSVKNKNNLSNSCWVFDDDKL